MTQTCIEVASQLLESMRDGSRIQWILYPERTAVIVKLSLQSELVPNAFASKVGINGATLAYFERGLNSAQNEWPELQKAMEVDNDTLFRIVAKQVPELQAKLIPLASQVPTKTHGKDSKLINEVVEELTKKVEAVRGEAGGRIQWVNHMGLLNEIKEAFSIWSQEGLAPRTFFNLINVHQDTFNHYFGKPSKKVSKAKKASKSKKTSPVAAAEPKTKKPTESFQHSVTLSDLLEAEYEVDPTDGSLLASVIVRLAPGSPEHTAVLRHRLA